MPLNSTHQNKSDADSLSPWNSVVAPIDGRSFPGPLGAGQIWAPSVDGHDCRSRSQERRSVLTEPPPAGGGLRDSIRASAVWGLNCDVSRPEFLDFAWFVGLVAILVAICLHLFWPSLSGHELINLLKGKQRRWTPYLAPNLVMQCSLLSSRGSKLVWDKSIALGCTPLIKKLFG